MELEIHVRCSSITDRSTVVTSSAASEEPFSSLASSDITGWGVGISSSNPRFRRLVQCSITRLPLFLDSILKVSSGHDRNSLSTFLTSQQPPIRLDCGLGIIIGCPSHLAVVIVASICLHGFTLLSTYSRYHQKLPSRFASVDVFCRFNFSVKIMAP